jgi:hypothetical protein
VAERDLKTIVFVARKLSTATVEFDDEDGSKETREVRVRAKER